MNYEINNPSFSDLQVAIFGDGQVRYKASTKWLPCSDFIETGFTWFGTAGKDLVIEFLDSIPSKNVVDLEKLENTIFPTLTNTSEDTKSQSYFGSFLYQSQELFCISVPRLIGKLELKEALETDPTSMTLWFSDEETESEKLVFILVTYIEGETKVEISYRLWLEDPEGNLGTSDVLLPRRDLHTRELPVTRCKGDMIWSCISGNLVGTKKLSGRPIFDMVASRGSEVWNKNRMYGLSDKVTLGKKTYESILPQNLGNMPSSGIGWIESGYIEKNLNYPIQILVSQVDGITPGSVTPYGTISIPYVISDLETWNKTFDYTENPGYQLTSLSVDGSKVLSPEDYTISRATKRVTVNIGAWVETITTGYLYFLFSEVLGKLKAQWLYTGRDTTTLEDSEILDGYFLESGTEIETILVEGEEVNPDEVIKIGEGGLEVGQEVKVTMEVDMEKYNLSRVILEYLNEAGEKVITSEGIVSGIGTSGKPYFSDTYNYITNTSGSDIMYPRYNIILDPKKFWIKTMYGEGIEVSETYSEVLYGSGKVINYYVLNPSSTVRVNCPGGINTFEDGVGRIVSDSITTNIEITIECE